MRGRDFLHPGGSGGGSGGGRVGRAGQPAGETDGHTAASKKGSRVLHMFRFTGYRLDLKALILILPSDMTHSAHQKNVDTDVLQSEMKPKNVCMLKKMSYCTMPLSTH